MSMTVRTKPQTFAKNAAKLARAPTVLEALCKRFEWEYQMVGPTQLRMNLVTKDTRNRYQYVTFDTKTGQFSHDSDYNHTLVPQLRKIVKEDGNLSDAYEVADYGVTAKLAHGCDWRWTGDDAIAIDVEKLKAQQEFA